MRALRAIETTCLVYVVGLVRAATEKIENATVALCVLMVLTWIGDALRMWGAR